jgi:predicted nucleic acid-binding protein
LGTFPPSPADRVAALSRPVGSAAHEVGAGVDLELADYERMAELVETYADFPLGTTDAAVAAVAERLGVSEIATLDRRHFHAVRPRHTGGFQLLP